MRSEKSKALSKSPIRNRTNMFSARGDKTSRDQDSSNLSKRSRSRIVQKPLGANASPRKIIEGRAETGSTHNFEKQSEKKPLKIDVRPGAPSENKDIRVSTPRFKKG